MKTKVTRKERKTSNPSATAVAVPASMEARNV